MTIKNLGVKKIFIFAIISFCAVLSYLLTNQFEPREQTPENTKTDALYSDNAKILENKTETGGKFTYANQREIKVSLQTDDVEISGKAVSGESIYDFMRAMRKQKKIDFSEKNYAGLGVFIESINGIENLNGYSWIYYINNKKAGVGISNYKLKNGDLISWKYEKEF